MKILQTVWNLLIRSRYITHPVWRSTCRLIQQSLLDYNIPSRSIYSFNIKYTCSYFLCCMVWSDSLKLKLTWYFPEVVSNQRCSWLAIYICVRAFWKDKTRTTNLEFGYIWLTARIKRRLKFNTYGIIFVCPCLFDLLHTSWIQNLTFQIFMTTIQPEVNLRTLKQSWFDCGHIIWVWRASIDILLTAA